MEKLDSLEEKGEDHPFFQGRKNQLHWMCGEGKHRTKRQEVQRSEARKKPRPLLSKKKEAKKRNGCPVGRGEKHGKSP